MWKKWRVFVFSIILSVGVGALSYWITRDSMDAYDALIKPLLTPPPFVFSIVWTILFILMGISATLIFKSRSPLRIPALSLYLAQLSFNFIWSILFFNVGLYGVSFFWLCILWILILGMILIFNKINKLSAIFQIAATLSSDELNVSAVLRDFSTLK